MRITSAGVVGSGPGAGEICEVLATAGVEVALFDSGCSVAGSDPLELIRLSLDRAIERWIITPSEKNAILKKIKPVKTLAELAGCQIIIEACNESPEEKKKVLGSMAEIAGEDAILITTAATVPLSKLVEGNPKAASVVAVHFHLPAIEVPIVELASHAGTAPVILERAKKFLMQIGREVVHIEESPGYVSTRLIVSLINEAFELLSEGVADASTVDRVMKGAFGLVRGPFELADRIGLDTVLLYLENLHSYFGHEKYCPSGMLRRLVRENRLGIKTGRGVYMYDSSGMKTTDGRETECEKLLRDGNEKTRGDAK